MSSTAAKSALVLELSAATSYSRSRVIDFDVRALRLLIDRMGLRMDNIHTPTVLSGSTTGQGVPNGVDKDKLSLMDLIAQKTKVEEELTALGSVLDSVCHKLHFNLMK